jgi:DNA-binding response OmpR family regulator
MLKRLLIVEDEPAILFALKLFFGRQGFSVDTARTREEAEELLALEPYDVVIADLRLGGSSSTEGLEIISEVHRTAPETKVILLTAYGSSEVELEARQRGAHALLHKPQPLPAIAQVVSSLLQSA